MKITCQVDQTTAILRGCEADATATLDIAVAVLTPLQRKSLAYWFTDGELRRNHSWLRLPEPSMRGFLEVLNVEVVKQTERDAATRAIADKKRLEFQNHYDSTSDNCIYISDNGTPKFYTEMTEADLREDQRPSMASAFEAFAVRHVKPQAAKELEAKVAEEGYAVPLVSEKLPRASQAEEIKAWALSHDSETLRLRVDEDFAWRALADEVWTNTTLIQVGIAEPTVDEIKDYEDNADVDNCLHPSAAEVKKLRRFRELLAQIPGSEVELRTVTYSLKREDDDYGGAEKLVRNELQVSVGGGRGRIRWYLAEEQTVAPREETAAREEKLSTLTVYNLVNAISGACAKAFELGDVGESARLATLVKLLRSESLYLLSLLNRKLTQRA